MANEPSEPVMDIADLMAMEEASPSGTAVSSQVMDVADLAEAEETRAAQQAQAFQRPKQEGSILNPLSQGLGFGWTDEALAGGMTVFALLTGDIKPNQAEIMFNTAKEGLNEQSESFDESHPVQSFVAEMIPMLAGGLPAIAERLAARNLGGAAAVGAGEAALYGAGTAKEGEAIKEGETLIPTLPLVGNEPIQSPVDVPAEIVSGAKDAPIGAVGGVVAGRVFNAGQKYLSDMATKKRLVREGSEDVRTAGLELKDPSQKVSTETEGDLQGIEAIKELSPLKPGVVKSEPAQRALAQRVPETQVVAIREANNETRELMQKMLKERRKGHTNRKYASNNPHYAVIGQSFDKRLSTVLDERKKAGKMIGDAVDGFKGKRVDYGNVVEDFKGGLNSHGIDIKEGKLDFSGVGKTSTLNEPSVRKTLDDVLYDLANAKDAADLHTLKRDIDKRVSYVKRLDGAADDDAEELLKQVRRGINTKLGELDPNYAAANKIYTDTSEAIDNLVIAMPNAKKFKFDTPEQIERSQKKIGQQLKKIQTNYTKKEDLNAAIVDFNQLSKDYGKTFNDDIEALVAFEGDLKMRFGDPLTNTFVSGIEAGTSRAKQKSTVLDKAGNVASRGWDFITDKARGVSDEEAFQALDDYLKESIK